MVGHSSCVFILHPGRLCQANWDDIAHEGHDMQHRRQTALKAHTSKVGACVCLWVTQDSCWIDAQQQICLEERGIFGKQQFLLCTFAFLWQNSGIQQTQRPPHYTPLTFFEILPVRPQAHTKTRFKTSFYGIFLAGFHLRAILCYCKQTCAAVSVGQWTWSIQGSSYHERIQRSW